MDLFHLGPIGPNTKSTYKKEIVILVIWVSVIIMCFWMRFNCDYIEKKWCSTIIVAGLVGCIAFSIFQIYLTIATICEIYWRRKDEKVPIRYKEIKRILVDSIVGLSEQEDILEIILCVGNSRVETGCSSYTKSFAGEFEDKRYYIGEQEFVSVLEYQQELMKYAKDGFLDVISIDGLKPDCFRLPE